MKEFTSLSELAQLSTIRNHLFDLLNGTRNAVKKGEVGQISALVQRLDAEIIHASLELFKSEQDSGEELDIAQKVAEAKAKMAQSKNKTTPQFRESLEAATLKKSGPPVISEPAASESQPAEEVKVPAKRTFKRVSKDEPSTV